VLAIWLLMRCADAVWFLALYGSPLPSRIGYAAVINSVVISTILLVCVWRRQDWARYLHLLLLGYVLFVGLLSAMRLWADKLRGDVVVANAQLPLVSAAVVLYLLGGVLLMSLRPIRRLVSRRYEL
jgi:glucan phosphoethanolaminetransferase (alkaline phosphatase superfamily)